MSPPEWLKGYAGVEGVSCFAGGPHLDTWSSISGLSVRNIMEPSWQPEPVLQTREFNHLLVEFWPAVCDDGPTLNQHCINQHYSNFGSTSRVSWDAELGVLHGYLLMGSGCKNTTKKLSYHCKRHRSLRDRDRKLFALLHLVLILVQVTIYRSFGLDQSEDYDIS